MGDLEELKPQGSRRYPKSPHIGVGILLIRDNKLLLVQRKFDPDAGFWSIPGGHIEIGERTETAAEREGFEETGFKVKVNRLAGIIDKIMYDKYGKIEYHYVLINYFVDQVDDKLNEAPIPDTDALDAKFVDFNELKNYQLSDSLVELLKELKIGY